MDRKFVNSLIDFSASGIIIACKPGYDLEIDFEKHTGIDLRTQIDTILTVHNVYQAALVPLGVKISLPLNLNCWATLAPRSGISKNTPIRLANAMGTIEKSYRNEICALLSVTNIFDDNIPIPDDYNYKGIVIRKNQYGKREVFIPKGTKIVQLLFNGIDSSYLSMIKVIQDDYIYDNFHEIFPSKRGLDGFGSTGVR